MEACARKRVRLEKGMGSLVDENDRGKWPSKKKNKNKKGERGAAAAPSGEGEEGVQLLGFFSFFVLPPFNCKIAPSLSLSFGPIFIGKMLFGSQNWSLNFFFL
jgi:hypothetical protein